MSSSKKYGFVIKKPSEPIKRKAKTFDEDDEEPHGSSKMPQIKGKISRTSALEIEKAVTEDPSVFEYDSLYDDFKAPTQKREEAAQKPKSRYIENLLKTAEKRKKEQERRTERKIQKERESEGDEFKDKEAFVTSAYKQKLLEMEQEKERELREQQIEEILDVKKQKDLSGFYRHLMKQKVSNEKECSPSSSHSRKRDDN